MDLTAHFYSQPSKLSAYPVYEKLSAASQKRSQKGGAPHPFLVQHRKRQKAMDNVGNGILAGLYGLARGIYAYKS